MKRLSNVPDFGDFDDPRRRLPWVLATALAIWGLLLGAFAQLLTLAPPPKIKPIEARLLEMPVRASGLQSSRPSAHPAPKPAVRPMPVAKRAIHHKISAHRAERRPPPSAESSVTSKTVPAPSTRTASLGASGTERSHVAEGGAGSIGSGAGGARAIYAPMPVIPDDLRENSLAAVAIASFRVAADGSAQVTLIQPTAIPRLNSLLLKTLEQWRFFPAIKDGRPVPSEFNVRIPIVVR
jgi:periplasmic protein TonB